MSVVNRKVIVDRFSLLKKISGFVLLGMMLLGPSISFAQQPTGSVEVDIKYINGDRVDYSNVVLKVYQDFDKAPFQILESVSSNPYVIEPLPLGHKYAIEVYVNSMYASVSYVDLKETNAKTNITIPLSGGLRFNVFYKDSITPIAGAQVLIKSHDGKQWAESTTDSQGNTLRSWIQSTLRDDNYYIADILITEDITYSYSPVTLHAGDRQDYKIVTPWPAVIDDLVTVYVYKDPTTKVSTSDGHFIAQLYDSTGKKVSESNVNARGEAFFSKIKIDNYTVKIVKLDDTGSLAEWATKKIIVLSGQTIQIFKPQPQSNSDKEPDRVIVNCNCVAFRLDTIQDYWLNNVQIELIDTFREKNAALTISILADSFGEDQKIINYIKEHSKTKKPPLEIANNGLKLDDLTSYNKEDQASIIKQSNEKIFSVLGISPTVFVPPYGNVNDDTFTAIQENKIEFVSAKISTDPPPYSLSNSTLYRFPATVFSGFTNTGDSSLKKLSSNITLNKIQTSLKNYGIAVVTMSFQDYAIVNDTKKVNIADMIQIQELEALIAKINDAGLRIVTISNINQKTPQLVVLPSWIKNNAKWWSEDSITENEFAKGIEFMIEEKIIIIPKSIGSSDGDKNIPLWIKNNAKWWSDGKISDDDFISALQYLIKIGIVKV